MFAFHLSIDNSQIFSSPIMLKGLIANDAKRTHANKIKTKIRTDFLRFYGVLKITKKRLFH